VAKFKSFTLNPHAGILNALIVPLTVINPVKHISFDTTGLLDTGCTMSAVAVRLARTLELGTYGSYLSHGANDIAMVKLHTVDLIMPGSISFSGLPVTEFTVKHQFEVLIGMDILSQGDFAITTDNSGTVASYRLPHGKPCIDWTQGREEQIAGLVDRILAAKRANLAADTSALEAEIGAAVYGLYNLSDDEIRIIEGETK
jgi:hypothetical protein